MTECIGNGFPANAVDLMANRGMHRARSSFYHHAKASRRLNREFLRDLEKARSGFCMRSFDNRMPRTALRPSSSTCPINSRARVIGEHFNIVITYNEFPPTDG